MGIEWMYIISIKLAHYFYCRNNDYYSVFWSPSVVGYYLILISRTISKNDKKIKKEKRECFSSHSPELSMKLVMNERIM